MVSNAMMAKVPRDALKALWDRNSLPTELAAHFNVSKSAIYTLAEHYKLGKRAWARDRLEQTEIDPSPEEIRERAAEMRQKWSDDERYRRAHGFLPRVEIRRFAYNGVSVCFNQLT